MPAAERSLATVRAERSGNGLRRSTAVRRARQVFISVMIFVIILWTAKRSPRPKKKKNLSSESPCTRPDRSFPISDPSKSTTEFAFGPAAVRFYSRPYCLTLRVSRGVRFGYTRSFTGVRYATHGYRQFTLYAAYVRVGKYRVKFYSGRIILVLLLWFRWGSRCAALGVDRKPRGNDGKNPKPKQVVR